MGNYDDWKAHNRMDDEDFRMPRCATPGCENRVTFDFDAFCTPCHQRFIERQYLKELHDEMEAAHRAEK